MTALTAHPYLEAQARAHGVDVTISQDPIPGPVVLEIDGTRTELTAHQAVALWELLDIAGLLICEACGENLAVLREDGRDVCLACVAPDLEPVRD